MGWKVDCNGFLPATPSIDYSVSATDGDMDIAFALCIAYNQWGGSYGTDARARINVIKANNYTFNTSVGKWIGEPRDYTTETVGNTSYWSPGLYRVFKDFTGDADWDAISNNTYDLLLATRNPTTGLNGNEISVFGNTTQNFVDYNGARSPWRFVIDYLWTGNTRAKDLTDKMTNWANGQGITNVIDGYLIDGTPTLNNGAVRTWNQSPAWTGAWACGAMSSSQAILDNFTNQFNASGYDGYYASSLRLLYQLTLTGNYWRPSAAGLPAPTTTLPATGSGVTYEAEKATLTGGTSVATSCAGYSGTGFVTNLVNAGSKMDFTVNAPVAGTYALTIRYNVCNDQNNDVKVNGTLVSGATTTFPLNGKTGCCTWQDKNMNVTLNAGNNTVTIAKNYGYTNIDYIILVPPAVNKKYEAESATLTGVNAATSCSGYSGTGFVTGLDATGDKIDFYVTASSGISTYTMTIRYNVCNDQYNDVKINGVLVGGASTLFGLNGNTGCCTWQNKTMTVTLPNLANTISIQKNYGYTNIDYIFISTNGATSRESSDNKGEVVTMLIFPNPAKGVIRFEIPGTEKEATVQMMDMTGVPVLSKDLIIAEGESSVEVNINSLKVGSYIIKAQRGHIVSTGKLVVVE